MPDSVRPPAWKTLLAFAIIYFVWGSTFLAIRVGVREVPPLVYASMRFFVAGAVLYIWMRIKGTPSPTRREWLALSLIALGIFVTRAVWNCGRDAGDHSGLHDVIGDHFSADEAAHRATRFSAPGRNRWSFDSCEPLRRSLRKAD